MGFVYRNTMHVRDFVLRIVIVIAAVGSALFFWVEPAFRFYPSQQLLKVTALDVGQGDAILIQTPRGDDVLIDGGPDDQVVERLAASLPAADRGIELVILTHPDLDHVGGLGAVAAHYHIDRVLETEVRSFSTGDRAWEQEISEQHSERLTARAGMVLHLDQVAFEVLWPQSAQDLKTKKRNDTSVVIRVTYGKTSFLFTGDMTSYVEERLNHSGTLTDVDVLKVPHHGSITSSSEEFLDAVKPEITLISVGKNNTYGHPHPVVVRRLKQRGMKVLRTDEVGDVTIISDGHRVEYSHK